MSKFFLYQNLHRASICLSYLSFFFALVAALLYLIQDYLLKNKRTETIFNKLPNLSFLDKLNYRSISFGFPLLTFSLVIGFVSGDSRNIAQIYSFIIWLIYAVILHVRLSEKMRGRKVAWLSLLAFGVIIISLFGSSY